VFAEMMEENISSLRVASDLGNLEVIRKFVEQGAKESGLSEDGVSGLRLAVDEACANIIMHGYRELSGDIEITITAGADQIQVALEDWAPSFNPLKRASGRDFDKPLDQRALGGMGVFLIRDNTDSAEYQLRDDGGNRLILTCLLQPRVAD